MPIGISPEHEELRRAVRRWVETNCPGDVVRASFDRADNPVGGPGQLPRFWPSLAEQGWLGIHLPEDLGGQGFGLLELAVVLEELGRAVAPGPFLPSALAGWLVARGAGPELAGELVPGLAEGRLVGCVAFGLSDADGLVARPAAGGGVVLDGVLPAVIGAPEAQLAVVPARLAAEDSGRPPAPGGPVVWCVVDLVDVVDVVDAVDAVDLLPAALGTHAVAVGRRPCLDLTRPAASLAFEHCAVPASRQLELSEGVAGDLALAMTAAELAGSARWCLETAAEHARTRVQFGRPIGQFQGVKHKLADLLCRVEQLAALGWDAALALDAGQEEQARLCAATVGALALESGVRAARDAIQVLGGMGFTWEHHVHLHLRRAATLRQLLGAGQRLERVVAERALAGARRSLGVELPAGPADALRRQLAPLVAEVAAGDPTDHRRLLGERGLLFPHWPAPYGRDAGPVEQLVIDQLLAEAAIRRPPAHVAAWALPTLIAHGTPEQQQRWVLPTLRGELLWCQLFSEPSAGSDLAALTTRAVRVPGGWRLTGQKVWTSVAARADVGICLARTDPDAPKHQGITYFVVDMRAEGIEVRPLREITGDALFNEVFFDGVFVPDDGVVGQVDGGWRLARTTLANERVALASGSAYGGALEGVLDRLAAGSDARALPPGLGALLVEAQSLAVLGQRATLRSVSGLEPGPESSVRKLLGAEHEQRVADLALVLCEAEGVYTDGGSASRVHSFLHTLCLTIAGGTSEVQRNVIGERLLGLPRDPEPAAEPAATRPTAASRL